MIFIKKKLSLQHLFSCSMFMCANYSSVIIIVALLGYRIWIFECIWLIEYKKWNKKTKLSVKSKSHRQTTIGKYQVKNQWKLSLREKAFAWFYFGIFFVSLLREIEKSEWKRQWNFDYSWSMGMIRIIGKKISISNLNFFFHSNDSTIFVWSKKFPLFCWFRFFSNWENFAWKENHFWLHLFDKE